MIQDNSGTRAQAADLLDKDPAPSCSDINPCVNQFLILQQTPDLTCSDPNGGVCIDPLATPSTGVPIISSGNEIRVVFNKLLEGVEDVDVDANGMPTGKTPYHIKSGLVELLEGASKTPVAIMPFWDPAGVSDFTSDIILVPFGPAIVIDTTLDPNSDYIIRLHTDGLKDKAGETAVLKPGDSGGTQSGNTIDIPFHTEAVTINAASTYPAFDPAKTPTISQNEVVSVALWSAVTVDYKSAVAGGTVPAGANIANIEIYDDAGSDPTKCAKNDSGGAQINLVYTNGPAGTAGRAPANWPAGNYSLTFTGTDTAGHPYTTPPLVFTVEAADASAPDNTFAKHITPEECTS